MAMSIDPEPQCRSALPAPELRAADGTFYNSPVYGYGGGGDYPGGTFSRYVQAGLNITGTDDSQVSTFYVASGGTEVSRSTATTSGAAASRRRRA
jgi:hypothetical protein